MEDCEAALVKDINMDNAVGLLLAASKVGPISQVVETIVLYQEVSLCIEVGATQFNHVRYIEAVFLWSNARHSRSLSLGLHLATFPFTNKCLGDY